MASGELAAGFFGHPARHEDVHPEGKVGAVDLERADRLEADRARAIEATHAGVGELLGAQSRHAEVVPGAAGLRQAGITGERRRARRLLLLAACLRPGRPGAPGADRLLRARADFGRSARAR